MVKSVRFLWGVVLWSISITSCGKKDKANSDNFQPVPPLATESGELAAKWADMTLYTIRFSLKNTPTYSSRSLGYLGLALYESIVPGDANYVSMSGQLNGYTAPIPDLSKEYSWPISLSAAQDTLLKLLYPIPMNSHSYIHARIDSLYNAILESKKSSTFPETVERSRKFGISVARAIYEWSKTDGGDEAYLRNFDPSYAFPRGNSYWIPPSFGQVVSFYPLHPRWGQNRNFIKANGEIPIPAIEPFSTLPTSAYYKYYKAVYDREKQLTVEDFRIAGWWADDPTETFSPPGHSYHLANIAVRKSNVSLIKAVESYARTGMAVADAFINCWRAKTTYFNERPSTYVRKYIDPTWTQLWPEPPFPAFPSGHSTQGAAAATVLTDLYGEPYPFTDESHTGQTSFLATKFAGTPYLSRSFNSFWDAARESALSRFLGGIHTQQDNSVGITEGELVGRNVNGLRWRR